MSRPRTTRTRRTRLAAVGGILLLSTMGLAACGDDDGGSSGAALDAFSVSGDPGQEPKVTFDEEVDPDGIETKVLTEGDGEELGEGDNVFAHIWMGNGYTQEKAFSTYDTKAPQLLTYDDLGKPFQEAIEGHTVGSRVAVVASAADTYGETGNPQLGIGNQDSILVVVDILGEHQTPKPKDVSSSKLPALVEKKGQPVGFDFSHVAKPSAGGDLLRAVLKEGSGPTVTTDMTVTADYLGEVYGAKKPFDESYSKKPVPFPLTSVVPGWTYGLSGLKVGSRVLLQIPPDLGYGDQAQANIPAGSTLYVVIDIRKAK